jgi:glycosyltransferase involved in cell wall biosynthesis
MVEGSPVSSPLRVVVLIPLRDDWLSAAELLRQLDRSLSGEPYRVEILLVDDASRHEAGPLDFPDRFAAIQSIRILRLRRNLGHQRAIAIGLVHIEESIPCDAVLVMDGDGEDTAAGALQLLTAFTGEAAVFAKRSRRTESFTFRVLYRVYKLIHYLLTGVKVEVGNLSILPARYLGTLVVTSELWNHYAAAVIRSGLLMTTIPIPRGHRIAGTSKMNFVTLAAHGMSAISVYGDVVGVRVLVASLVGSLMAAAGIVVIILLRIFANRGVPGWASLFIGALAIIFIQFLSLALSFTFTFLSNRINLSFVPLRDYALFVAGVRDIWPNE